MADQNPTAASSPTRRVISAAIAYRRARDIAARQGLLGIPPPPKYWDEFCDALDALTLEAINDVES